MISLLVVIWALLVAETLTSLVDWHGLTLFGRRWLMITGSAPLIVSLLLVYGYRWPDLATFAASTAIGLIVFAVLVSWRRRSLGPEQLFTPGEQAARRVQQVLIPIDKGPLPAILVEPMAQVDAGVLVVHGAGDHKTHFTWPLLHALADAQLAACAIDVDGHGDNPRILDFPSVLDNVRVAVAWLRQRYAFVAVVGISQGGCISARAVAEGVDVDAVVLMETPTQLHLTRAVIRSEMRILAHPAAWALHREVGTIGLARSWRTAPTRSRISTVDLIKRLDAAGSVARIGAPLLLVYGGSDAVVPPEQAREMANAAPPGATLMIVPRATHLSLSIDRRVVRTIAAWLRKVAGETMAG